MLRARRPQGHTLNWFTHSHSIMLACLVFSFPTRFLPWSVQERWKKNNGPSHSTEVEKRDAWTTVQWAWLYSDQVGHLNGWYEAMLRRSTWYSSGEIRSSDPGQKRWVATHPCTTRFGGLSRVGELRQRQNFSSTSLSPNAIAGRLRLQN